MTEHRNPFMEILSGLPEEERGIFLTRDQLNAWSGFDLTDDQVESLEESIPNSSIPEAIAMIAEQFHVEEDDDA